MSDVERPSIKRTRAGAVIAIAATIGVLHSLVVNLGDHAPLRAAGRPDWPARVQADQFMAADDMLRSAAAGHNLQLVIDSPNQAGASLQNLFTQLYFRAAFTLFPKRVYAGTGDQVINDWPQLSSSATNPGHDFLATHDVRQALTLSAASGAMSLRVQPADSVPKN